MKSSKLYRVIWIVGVYAILLTILYLVILYKVEWEDKDLNTYLYFYDCNGELCSSQQKVDSYYSKVKCENDICPYIEERINNNVILTNDNYSWIYDYVSDKIINNNYMKYKYLRDDMYIVMNNEGTYGVIDLNGDVIVETKYPLIKDYKNGYITYFDNNLYGIINEENDYKLSPQYEDIVLINDKLFASKKDNLYQLHSYDDVNSDNDNKYDYLYSINDVILTISNKKIDILDTKLNSMLLMKINTFYNYTVEKERDSLGLHFDNSNIYFKVYTSENDYVDYIYNFKSKKLI